MQEQVAIVILNYNGAEFINQFIPTVIRCSKAYRIIVADNCSTDDSIAILDDSYPEVEIIRLDNNYGFAAGYNRALQQIKASYYILLNSDVEVSDAWVEPMLALLESKPKIAACQPKIRSFYQRDFFEYAGACGGELDLLGYPFCRGRIMETLEEDMGQYDTSEEIFWATGACMMIRSDIFHKLGGFDERFFAHMEEIDLCWRIHHVGYQVYVCHSSEVYHVGGGTLPKSNPRKTFLNFRNGLWMLYKNSSMKELIWKLPARLLLDYIALILFLIKGRYEDAANIFKAHRKFVCSISGFSKDRKKLRGSVLKEAPLYRGLIVWDYFIKGKKKYIDLKINKD